MTDCGMWESEAQFTLTYDEEEDLSPIKEVHRCLLALKELKPVVQPLSVEFVVKCRHLKRLAFSYEIMPEFPYWNWEISSVPSQIITEGFYPSGAKVTQVENITTEELSKWIVEPLKQKPPDPEYNIWWSEINICATRAKIINPTVIDEIRCVKRDCYLVDTLIGELKYPLVKQDNSLWVYSPQKPYKTYPTMTISIISYGGTHGIKFSIPWTVWYDESSPEYFCFYQAIQRIIAQGWQLSKQTPMKEPKYAA